LKRSLRRSLHDRPDDGAGLRSKCLKPALALALSRTIIGGLARMPVSRRCKRLDSAGSDQTSSTSRHLPSPSPGLLRSGGQDIAAATEDTPVPPLVTHSACRRASLLWRDSLVTNAQERWPSHLCSSAVKSSVDDPTPLTAKTAWSVHGHTSG
jgi:hypothetical protein